MLVVSREHIARSARRHDTVMAWAFRRALGVTAAPRRRPGGGAGGVRLEALRYGGIEACMSNRGRSPVEW